LVDQMAEEKIDAFILKPYELSELLQIIRSALDK